MQENPANGVPNSSPPSLGPTSLLIEWPSAGRVFCDNLRDLFSSDSTAPRLTSASAAFWPDVFVHRPVAWRSMASSALYHVFGVVVIYAMSVTWAQRAPIRTHNPFDNSKITYYSVSEYLPEINTGEAPAPAKVEKKGEPKWAKQRIISLPPAPDNFRQTIITPSKVKLPATAMPNLVAWTPVPSPVPEGAITSNPRLPSFTPEAVAPAPSVDALRAKSAMPMQPEVVAPPPALDAAKSKTRLPNIPEPSVVEPPVSAHAAARLGDMNIARLDPAVAAPKLPVPEQRTASAGSAGSGAPQGNGGGNAQAAVVQPSPDVAGLGNGKRATGQMIALGLDPAAVSGPINVPQGSRYGQFAATPEGNPNAPGTPEIKGGGTNGGGSGKGSNGGGSGRGSGPPGISVGPGPWRPNSSVVAQGDPLEQMKANANAAMKETRTVASLERPRMTDIGRTPHNAPHIDPPEKIEDKVFGKKHYYSMILNMPNLASAGGSWIIRFAELHESAIKGDVVAPEALVKVDPAYPQDLMRDRVEGTVTLYAVIHKDGTVGNVKVLRGVDERLDQNACIALARWKFQPGTKNGSAVDLEAVVQIPFLVKRMPF